MNKKVLRAGAVSAVAAGILQPLLFHEQRARLSVMWESDTMLIRILHLEEHLDQVKSGSHGH